MTATLTPDLDSVRDALAAALAAAQAYKPCPAADNPATALTLTDLTAGRGVDKTTDLIPAVDMPAKLGEGKLGFALSAAMDNARRDGIAAGRADRSARRMAQARQRAARKAQIDALADSPVVPSRERLAAAWLVVTPLERIVRKIADGKRAWAKRYLGSLADDVASIALEKMVLVLAKGEQDLAVLRTAAEQLAGVTARTGRLPGDQDTRSTAERKHDRDVAKGRKWLMGVCNNRVMGALVDAYTDQRNLRWENIDLIATVMVSISAPGEDPAVANALASKPPSMMGTKFRRPDSFDANWLSLAITGAITERGLDRLVELLLDDDRRRTDGAFCWTANAEAVFLASPDMGEFRWSLVKRATDKLADPRRARGDAARAHVRDLFAFLPSVITGAVQAFELDEVGFTMHTDGTCVSLIRSEFEARHGKSRTGRTHLRPALTFGDAAEAAAALTRFLAVAVEAKDFLQ